MRGLICALGAYLIWGFSPIYFKALKAVSPFEILMHRMIWSFVLLLLFLWGFKRVRSFGAVLKNRSLVKLLTVTTLLVGFNWFLFIWAINNDRILDASLGYFICPIVNVLLGAVILRERLRQLQWLAVALAASAVVCLTVYHGSFPWVALGLAFSFGFYGLLRKTASVDALEGLAVETLLMFLPAVGYLIWLDGNGLGAFRRIDHSVDLLLMGTALVTAVPLLLFTMGARRINFATIGFLQYVAPSCTFALAVFVYHEPFAPVKAWTFAGIWTALALYSLDALIQYRTLHSTKVVQTSQ